jgi:hypothetical protein
MIENVMDVGKRENEAYSQGVRLLRELLNIPGDIGLSVFDEALSRFRNHHAEGVMVPILDTVASLHRWHRPGSNHPYEARLEEALRMIVRHPSWDLNSGIRNEKYPLDLTDAALSVGSRGVLKENGLYASVFLLDNASFPHATLASRLRITIAIDHDWEKSALFACLALDEEEKELSANRQESEHDVALAALEEELREVDAPSDKPTDEIDLDFI